MDSGALASLSKEELVSRVQQAEQLVSLAVRLYNVSQRLQ